jgi:hypothetical protein
MSYMRCGLLSYSVDCTTSSWIASAYRSVHYSVEVLTAAYIFLKPVHAWGLLIFTSTIDLKGSVSPAPHVGGNVGGLVGIVGALVGVGVGGEGGGVGCVWCRQ